MLFFQNNRFCRVPIFIIIPKRSMGSKGNKKSKGNNTQHAVNKHETQQKKEEKKKIEEIPTNSTESIQKQDEGSIKDQCPMTDKCSHCSCKCCKCCFCPLRLLLFSLIIAIGYVFYIIVRDVLHYLYFNCRNLLLPSVYANRMPKCVLRELWM